MGVSQSGISVDPFSLLRFCHPLYYPMPFVASRQAPTLDVGTPTSPQSDEILPLRKPKAGKA